MKSAHRFSVLMAALFAVCPVLMAQENSEAPPLNLGGFNTEGSATVGYRFDTVKGYQPQFLQLFDLQPGFRLQDFNMFGEAQEGHNSFADSYSLSMSGLGGDPFPTAQLSVIKNNRFDFRANWRQSYYYWNQNDNVVLPIAAVGSSLAKGLTDNHDWATVRKFGSADLTLHATNHLRFNFDYYRTTDSGALFTTRSIDFLGSPDFWGSFARANPYSLFAPLNDETNRFTGGVDYTWHSWNFHYNLGYQTFNENINLNNVASPELSINTGASASASEPLTSTSWSQARRLTSPLSEFSFTGKPLSKLEWRGEYIYYHFQGPATFDQSANGVAPDSTGAFSPYTFTQSVRAMVKEPDHVISTGFTYDVNSWWNVNLDYRYSRLTSEGIGNLASLFSQGVPAPAPTASTAQDDNVWRNGISDLDFTLGFTPTSKLTLRPGIHLLKEDVETFENGVIDLAHTLRIKTVAPEISIAYQPSKMFSIRGDLHSFTNGASFTAITPHTLVGGHVVVRFQPTAKVALEDEMNLSNSRLLDTGFQSNVRSNALMLSYSFSDQFSVFGGFSYDSFYAQGDIVYIRGTPPLNDFLQDQEVNRVWQGGVETRPVKRFGLRLSGNYDRSTGLGYISGEPPAYGPLRWPLVTGTVYYDFPKAGRLSIDLQRTYYIEQIVTANNFGANLLTIRWTRNF
ncbi:MAG TPA: hypothetical protein VGW33_03065 [Terriglobia bacterium]|nr:hypothetical protein [Terriglobia bacterium]